MKRILIILIVILCGGCFDEYAHKPNEISLGANMSETNFGRQGKAPTTGGFVMLTWYREKK